MKKEQVDVVWISGWRNRYFKYLLYEIVIFKLFMLKVVYDTIDPIFEYMEASEYSSKLETAIIKTVLNIVYRMTDLSLVVTPQLKKLMVRNGAPEKKLKVVNFGTNNFSNSVSTNFELFKKRDVLFVIGWLGSMSKAKGIEKNLLPTIQLVSKFSDDISFLIAGQGPLFGQFERLKKEVGDRLILLGRLNYNLMPSFTKSLHIYVIPLNSDNEFSNSVYR
ncbi:MAG: glycosyltransferase family 4 protein [Methanosarcinales archaeon]|nr:glycosyltransferase family 4 protein [Methanosarcinales archaeon]